MYRLVFHKLSSLFPPFNLFVNAAFGKAKHCNTVRFKLCQCFMIGVTPTCAGTAISLEHREILAKDHPRLRGYYLYLYKKIIQHARITPACAGTTRIATICTLKRWDHPRLRGYYLISRSKSLPGTGSPPLARVLPKGDSSIIALDRITPACAGTTLFAL